MIKINLIPGGVKKKKILEKAKREKPTFNLDKILNLDKLLKFGPYFIKAGIILLPVLVVLHIFLSVSFFFKKASLNSLNSQWQALQPRKGEIEKLRSQSASLEKVVTPIKQLVGRKILWSKKMNQISDLMVPGIWLTHLSIERQLINPAKEEYAQALKLEGCATSSGEDVTAVITKFTNVLQEDKEFSSDFSEIKIGPMEKIMLGNSQIMKFSISCRCKKGLS